ncbi:hypothetical protein RM96_03765 [Cupriavidus sp. IDO]|nr:hypothetical protein RM96_03765 [Cupriavidus sp. IDO]
MLLRRPTASIDCSCRPVASSAASPAHCPALATQAKAHLQKITYATPGIGTLLHLMGVVLDKDSSVSLQHVPYKGAGSAINDLRGGQVDVLITPTSTVAGFIQSGRMRWQ